MAEGIDRRDLRRVRPGGEGADVEHGRGKSEVGHVSRIESTDGDGEAGIDAVGALVGTDRVALRGMGDRAENGAAFLGKGEGGGEDEEGGGEGRLTEK